MNTATLATGLSKKSSKITEQSIPKHLPIEEHYLDKFLVSQKKHLQGVLCKVDSPSHLESLQKAFQQGELFDSIVYHPWDANTDLSVFWKALKPGGVLLISAPAVEKSSQNSKANVAGLGWTRIGMQRFIENSCVPAKEQWEVQVTSYGNKETLQAFLQGIPAQAIKENAWEVQENSYAVLITAVVCKSAVGLEHSSSLESDVPTSSLFEGWERDYSKIQGAYVSRELAKYFPENTLSDKKVLHWGGFVQYFLEDLGVKECYYQNSWEFLPKEAEGPFTDVVLLDNFSKTKNPFEILQKAHQVLEPQGQIIVEIPFWPIEPANAMQYTNNNLKAEEGLYQWNPSTLGNLVAKAGFEVVEASVHLKTIPENYVEIIQENPADFDRECQLASRRLKTTQIRVVGVKSKSGVNVQTNHYDQGYFENFQKMIGMFGGMANQFKFEGHIHSSDVVLDFGCGGGFLLKNIPCQTRLGVEINDTARAHAELENGVQAYGNLANVPDTCADKIISNHALEHVSNPVETLQELSSKLKPNGKMIFVLPCENSDTRYLEQDPNQHLYCWSAQSAKNLWEKAGYNVESVELIQHQWPSNYTQIVQEQGWHVFHEKCRAQAMSTNNYQIKVVATVPAAQ